MLGNLPKVSRDLLSAIQSVSLKSCVLQRLVASCCGVAIEHVVNARGSLGVWGFPPRIATSFEFEFSFHTVFQRGADICSLDIYSRRYFLTRQLLTEAIARLG